MMWLALALLALPLQDPAPAADEATVELPPVAADASPRLIRPDAPRPESRRIADRPDAGPSLGGFLFWTGVVMALLGGAFVLLKRFGRGGRFLGGASPITVLARKPLGQRQEIFLVEVGPKVFMVGSTRDHLTTLGEFSQPDDVAVLRANLPRRDASPAVFRESLREGLREAEAPAPPEGVYESIAGELAEIRKTVRAWRA